MFSELYVVEISKRDFLYLMLITLTTVSALLRCTAIWHWVCCLASFEWCPCWWWLAVWHWWHSASCRAAKCRGT